MATVLLTGHGSLSLNDFSGGGSSLSLKSFVRLVSGVSVSESGLVLVLSCLLRSENQPVATYV
jgi:hypothetical protein